MKVGLFIINQLHDITHAGYEVKFCEDFNGMMRLEFYKEFEANFYEHYHLGYPDCPREVLEKAVIDTLAQFRETYQIG